MNATESMVASGRDRNVRNDIIVIGQVMACCRACCGRNVRFEPLVDVSGCAELIVICVIILDSTSYLVMSPDDSAV